MSANETIAVEIPVRMIHRYNAARETEISAPFEEWEKARENRLNEANLIAIWALLEYEEQYEETRK